MRPEETPAVRKLANHCYLALGSNLQTPERQLRQALAKLRRLPGTAVLNIAKFYRNPAQGRKAQPDFYNTVILIQTRLKPQQLLSHCQAIEKQQGRIRRQRWGSRTLDIDILFYKDIKIKTPKLIIPHPRYSAREFVLIPLIEVASSTLLKQIQPIPLLQSDY
ncbi:MAG: 2-amino-4-hydroxy-6-hydroxymethyldihydropteridine diphosphokinase [Legionella sp.]|nr:2-amino-4-hydroxy-6-hydroxymethyldihydropteridine diphosphokinase [Legionella sp.]